MLTPILLLIAGQSLQPTSAIALVYKPELGDKVSYELTQTFTDMEDGTKHVLVDRIETKVFQRDSLGIIATENSYFLVSEQMDGQPIPLAKDQPPFVLKERRKANGILESRDDTAVDANLAFRVARMTTQVFPNRPVRVGESWTVNVKPEAGSQFPGLDAIYRLVKLDPTSHPNDAILAIEFHENGLAHPLTAMGESTVDLATGLTRKLHLSVENALIPGGEGQLQKLDYLLVAKKFETKHKKAGREAGQSQVRG